MTKPQMEDQMIHLLCPSPVKLLKKALRMLLKSSIYIDRKGKALKKNWFWESSISTEEWPVQDYAW